MTYGKEKELLRVENLKVSFPGPGKDIQVIEDVSFNLHKGEVLGIVGESGCGKSVTAEAILQLLDKDTTRYSGKILLKGLDLLELSDREMTKIRGNEISMIFQDPMSSLNPVQTIGKQIAEAIRIHQDVSKREAKKRSIDLLRRIGIPSPEERYKQYPHEISGGMRQRVMIAMALSCLPSLLIADEPTTALDVTIQAQILNLISKFQKDLQMGVILITHDFGVVANYCTKVAVMYLGQIIEQTDVNTLFSNPLHPYTNGLINSIPKLDEDRQKELLSIKGAVPSLAQTPKGCRFASRCEFVTDRCLEEVPTLETLKNGHQIRCWNYNDIRKAEAVYV